MADFRALCAELLSALESWSPGGGGPLESQEAEKEARLIERARAALAGEPTVPQGREPAAVTGQPSDGEVAELTGHLIEAANGAAAMGWDQHAQRILRAAELLQHLSPPQPLANGEVGKPVAWMCPAEPYFDGNKWHDQWQVTLDQRLAEYWARPGKPTPLFTRAAELLQRQALVPVPGSERPWEREEWCDPDGLCWLGSDALDGSTPTWLYGPPAWAEQFPNVHRVLLPAHALPLPEADK